MRLCSLNTQLFLSLLAFTAGFDPVAAAESLQKRGNGDGSDSYSENCVNGACTTTTCQNNVCTVCSNGSCNTSTKGQASPTKANAATLTTTPNATGTGKSNKKHSTSGFTFTFTGTTNPSATKASSSDSAGNSRKGLSIGAIVGIAVAGAVVIGLLMMCLLSRRASARQKRRRPRGTTLLPAGSSTPSRTITPKVSDSEMGESIMKQSLLAAAAQPAAAHPAALRASHQSWVAAGPPPSPYTPQSPPHTPHNLRTGYPPENVYTNEFAQSHTRLHNFDPHAGGRNYHSVYDLPQDYGNLHSPHVRASYNPATAQMYAAVDLASMPSGANRFSGSNPTNQRSFVGHSHGAPTHAPWS